MKHNDLRKTWRYADDLNRAREVEMVSGSRFGNSLGIRVRMVHFSPGYELSGILDKDSMKRNVSIFSARALSFAKAKPSRGFMKYLFSLALLGVLQGCDEDPSELAIRVRDICPIAEVAFEKRELQILFEYLEKELGMNTESVRVEEVGVFIPIEQSFVEEEGYFLLAPGNEVMGDSEDPAFHKIEQCLYHYRIKG